MTNNTSAIAPWLGYSAQEYRLVQRLLKAPKNNILGFEILDDVQEQNGEKTILEQDKISLTDRNIVSNQSKDLWKTLSNWCDLIKSGEINPSFTEFLLYTNNKHTSDALELLIGAKNVDEAEKASVKLRELVNSPSDNIKTYVDNFFSLEEQRYLLISNFQYIYGSGSVPQDLLKSYLEINTSVSEYSQDIIHEILGWTKDTLTLLAEQRLSTLVSAKSFGQRLGQIESKYRQQSLLEFICSRASEHNDVQSELTEDSTYIKQLKLIELDDIDIEDAVIAKLESKDAVAQWTIEGHIQEASYSKYNSALNRKWKLQKNITFRDKINHSDVNKGALLYFSCLDSAHNIKLENKAVDEFFAHGSYQNLADTKEVGWHPDYRTKLKGDSNDT